VRVLEEEKEFLLNRKYRGKERERERERGKERGEERERENTCNYFFEV